MTPRFSVIVPVYRQWDLAPKLLACLRAQTFPAENFEAILVDNEPDTLAPALDLPEWARIVPCPSSGSYAARNAGAAVAAGEFLAFTDADCLPGPNWLAAMADAVSATPETLLAGPIGIRIQAERPNFFESYDRIRGIPQERYARSGYATTANLVVPAALFRKLGGFDSRRFSGGDAEFCRRAGAIGGSLRMVPAALVSHPARATWMELSRKARRVKGGQITSGARSSRMIWLARTATPPLRALLRFVQSAHPLRERASAALVLFALWGVEIDETMRLLAGKAPERR